MITSFNVELFKNQLRTTWLGSEIVYIKQVNSTNTYAKQIPSTDLVHGTVVITDNQLKGRGQYEKKWKSLPGKDLTFTIGLCPSKADRLTLLTLGFALSVANILQEYTKESVFLKWPNDILVSGKKIGGLLTECIFKGQNPDRVIIGIGINVGNNRFSGTLKNKATSLGNLSEEKYSRERLLADLLSEMEQVYHLWHKMDPKLQNGINKKLINYGEWVQLRVDGKTREGTFKFLGINEKGELITLNEELDVNTFSYEQVRILPNRKQISAGNRSAN